MCIMRVALIAAACLPAAACVIDPPSRTPGPSRRTPWRLSGFVLTAGETITSRRSTTTPARR